MTECKNNEHNKVILDKFSQLQGVTRSVPGDCYCLDCKQPIPAYWNSGKPKPMDHSVVTPGHGGKTW